MRLAAIGFNVETVTYKNIKFQVGAGGPPPPGLPCALPCMQDPAPLAHVIVQFFATKIEP